MTSGKRLAVAAGIGLVTLFGWLSAAEAQYRQRPYYGPPPVARGMYREGVVFGFGIGGGSIIADQCSNCGAGGGLEVHLGGMATPRLAVMGELWGLGRPVNGGTLSNGVFVAAVQFWVVPILWIKGGIGGGNISFEDSFTGEQVGESALAFSGAGGIEVLQSYNFALDLQLRVSHTAVSLGGATNIAFLVGFNWY